MVLVDSRLYYITISCKCSTTQPDSCLCSHHFRTMQLVSLFVRSTKKRMTSSLRNPWQSCPTIKKIPYQQANLSPDIEVLKHADTKMVLHSEIGLLGLPGRSRSLPLPCPTRCSCCCHRSTSLPGARRGMLRWVRWCWDSWFSLRWTVLAFEQHVNIEWTGFVRICLWNCNISPTWKLWIVGFPERDCLAKFFGKGWCC